MLLPMMLAAGYQDSSGLRYTDFYLNDIIISGHLYSLADHFICQSVQFLNQSDTVTKILDGPFIVVFIHINAFSRVGKRLHRRLYEVNPVRFSASSADIPALRYTFEVVLIAAAAVRPVPGGLDPALIEDEIATAATVHSNLPSILMGLGKGIHKLLLGIKKILDLQHVVKLAFNLMAQAKLVDLEIAGIRSCGIPGIHCVVSEVILQISGHIRS
jgi:hypothetical protein